MRIAGQCSAWAFQKRNKDLYWYGRMSDRGRPPVFKILSHDSIQLVSCIILHSFTDAWSCPASWRKPAICSNHSLPALQAVPEVCSCCQASFLKFLSAVRSLRLSFCRPSSFDPPDNLRWDVVYRDFPGIVSKMPHLRLYYHLHNRVWT